MHTILRRGLSASGCRFQIVQALLTNFHLPQSTLLMLVCALGGKENVLRAYQHAVAQRYRFYCYRRLHVRGVAGS